MPKKEILQRLPRGAHEIAQNGNVGAVGANASRVHGQPQPLRKFEVHASIIKLGETESLGR